MTFLLLLLGFDLRSIPADILLPFGRENASLSFRPALIKKGSTEIDP